MRGTHPSKLVGSLLRVRESLSKSRAIQAVAAYGAVDDWFYGMSPDNQKKYVELHPRSKYARDWKSGRHALRQGDHFTIKNKHHEQEHSKLMDKAHSLFARTGGNEASLIGAGDAERYRSYLNHFHKAGSTNGLTLLSKAREHKHQADEATRKWLNTMSLSNVSAPNSQVQAATSENEGGQVDPVQSSLYDLFTKVYEAYFAAHTAHWNVVDGRFEEAHRFFQDVYSQMFGYIDLIAELMRTSRLKGPSNVPHLDIPVEDNSYDHLCLMVFRRLTLVEESTINCIGILGSNPLYSGTVNKLQDVLAETQKLMWRARSILSNQVEKEQ
jgi:hypothetical protein